MSIYCGINNAEPDRGARTESQRQKRRRAAKEERDKEKQKHKDEDEQEQEAGAAKRHQNEPKQSAAMAASRSQSQFGAAFWGLQLRKYCFKDYTVTTATATATARHRARNCNTHTHAHALPRLASPGRSSAAHSRTERNERRKLLQRNVATAPATGLPHLTKTNSCRCQRNQKSNN